jgi:hypothetical protein
MSPQTWDTVGLAIAATFFTVVLIAGPDLVNWAFMQLMGWK